MKISFTSLAILGLLYLIIAGWHKANDHKQVVEVSASAVATAVAPQAAPAVKPVASSATSKVQGPKKTHHAPSADLSVPVYRDIQSPWAK